MKHLLPLILYCLATTASTAAADIKAVLGSCLNAVDADVHDAASSSLKDRILALPHYAENESFCISNLTTQCMAAPDRMACLAQMQDGLTTFMHQVHSALPPAIEGQGEMQANYNAWMVRVRNGKAVADAQSCKLPPDYPPEACDIILKTSALIEARDWQRNLAVLKKARAEAAQSQAVGALPTP